MWFTLQPLVFLSLELNKTQYVTLPRNVATKHKLLSSEDVGKPNVTALYTVDTGHLLPETRFTLVRSSPEMPLIATVLSCNLLTSCTISPEWSINGSTSTLSEEVLLKGFLDE